MKKISMIEMVKIIKSKKQCLIQFTLIGLGVISLVLSGCAQLQNNHCCGDSSHCLSCDKIPSDVLMTNLNANMTNRYYQVADGRLCTLPDGKQIKDEK